MIPALVECRFCGSEDVTNYMVDGKQLQVCCNACGASGPAYKARETFNGLSAQDAAAKAWNTGKAVV